MVLFSLASFPNSPIYFFSELGNLELFYLLKLKDSAIFLILSAVACATSSISFACPSASLMRFCFSPSRTPRLLL